MRTSFTIAPPCPTNLATGYLRRMRQVLYGAAAIGSLYAGCVEAAPIEVPATHTISRPGPDAAAAVDAADEPAAPDAVTPPPPAPPPPHGPSPYGSLGRAIWGDDGPGGRKIALLGWGMASAVASTNDSHGILPTGFLNADKGLSLNQAALVLCSGDACPPQVFGPSGGVYARIGPFPGPRKEQVDIGFNITAVYGEDAQFFTAQGFEDGWGVNAARHENKLAIPQAFVDVYLPIANGTRILAGSFFTSLANEIGLPFNPPNWFVTRTHAFAHGPARHLGVVADTRLNTSERFGHLSVAYGLVNGWNVIDDPNESWDFLGAVHYRTPDMQTAVDLEGIYGNGRGENNTGYLTAATDDRYLKRYDIFLTITHQLDRSTTVAAEFNFGHHDGGNIAPIPIFLTRNADWGGANLGIRKQVDPRFAVAARAEWFTDAQGASVAWAGSPGSVVALTANMEWAPFDRLRIRPEVRYDIFDGKRGALPLFDDHRSNDQLIGVLNVFVPF